MQSCKHFFYVVLIFICGLTNAQTLTISIVQNENAPAIAIDMSRTIEDQLMDSFFDLGFIVSNSDIRFDGNNFVKNNFAIKEAAFGMSDLLLAVQLTYSAGEKMNIEKKNTYAQLENIVWRLVRVKDSSIITEKIFDISSVPVKDFDPYKKTRSLAKKIAENAHKAIREDVKKEKK